MGCCSSASSKVVPHGQTLEGYKNKNGYNDRPIDGTQSVFNRTENREGPNDRGQQLQRDETENIESKRNILPDEETRG
jgi:hypothetical protein